MEEPQPSGQPCATPGCRESGDYRAPKTRGEKPEYQWFCLDHVRDYNKSWNYFEGMSQAEIEAYMKEAVTGHRPTWYMGGNGAVSPERLQDALARFMAAGMQTRTKAVPPLPRKLRKALEELELEHPTSHKDIKKRYKMLVKQYHPDVNHGDKDAEERFKRITIAYKELLEDYPEHGV
jgi:hypothetical protein